MSDVPANHKRLVKRIQSLCSELADTIETAQEQRQRALDLAKHAIELATAVGDDERAERETKRARSAKKKR